MGEHRFREALDLTRSGRWRLAPGTSPRLRLWAMPYADMGEYEKAGTAYSRLSGDSNSGIVGNLHAGQDAGASASAMPNPPADPREAYAQHTRTAYLQFIAGDTTAAIKGMETSIGEGVESHLPSENLAWLYYELGEFRLQAGEVQAGGRCLSDRTHDPPWRLSRACRLGQGARATGRVPAGVHAVSKRDCYCPDADVCG